MKEDDKYTCPICDYRVKIPRDAARPKLEELIEWRNEIPRLPFIPDEMDCLDRIIKMAQNFRDRMQQFTNRPGLSQAELPVMRFYLRKIEGAEILLAQETNFFRTELHRWSPIAPDPPPVIDCSNSTRKPRPTKQQKLMAQYGVNTPEELPMTLRTKAHTFNKKKMNEPNKPAPIKPAPYKCSAHPSSSSMSPVQLHTPLIPHHPPFEWDLRFSQVSAQYNQQPPQIVPSPSLLGTPGGATSMGSILLTNYCSQGSTFRRESRDTKDFNHLFEQLPNRDPDSLSIEESVSSSVTSPSSHSSVTPSTSASAGIPLTGSAPPSLAAAALQLTSDAIDPFLTDTTVSDDN